MLSLSKLIKINKLVRKKIIQSIFWCGSGHAGPSLSVVEILSTIIIDNIDYKAKDRNRIILSKGHAVPALYAIFDYLKLLKKNELKKLRTFNSRLQGHPDKRKLHLLDAGTGALGQGLSIAIGYSLGFNMKKKRNKVFCILGDGELQEGQVWEAAMFIGVKKIKNILTFIDGNKFQNENSIKNTLDVKNLKEKWESFGFKYFKIDGHNINAIRKINKKFISGKFSKPIVVYCDTTKGKGVSFMENNNSYHTLKDMKKEDYDLSINEIMKS